MRYWEPKTFTNPPTVTMIVSSYLGGDRSGRLQSLRCLLLSFMTQTYPHWKAVVVHDGPLEQPGMAAYITNLDARISLVQTPAKLGHFGHKHRHPYAVQATPGWVGFTNDDNYYVPVYFEWLIHEALRRKAEMVYCDCVHSHRLWKPFSTMARYKHLDVGGFLARTELVKRTPWTDFSFKGDGIYINALVAKSRATVKVAATLFVHN